jgi:glycerate-2-kinase
MKAGADINELNTARKHLSNVQGGQLAKIAYPARIIGFVFSDVIGNDISTIASGPLSKDTTTAEDAVRVLEKYDIMKVCKLPDCQVVETPKEDKYFENVNLFLAVDNNKALEAMKTEAQKIGYDAIIETSILLGEAREVGEMLAKKNISARQALLFGGETTVTVSGEGKGGRNEELALGALPYVGEHMLVLSAASDGHDNTDAAGAIADLYSVEKASKLGLNYKTFLAENNSYEFWKKVDSQIITGPTGANVSDLMIVLCQ